MTQARYIPAVGETFKGYVPAVRQVHKITIGSSSDADIQVGETGVYKLVTVSEPVTVFGMWTQCETAFTTSVTLTVGDSTTADLFFADTTMNIAATGAVLIASTGLTVPIAYTTARDIEGTIAGATVAAGLLNVYIDYAVVVD
jgi:hypothetical protein